MSLENAILAHAAALTELAAAIRAGFGGAFAPVHLVAGSGEKIKGTITHGTTHADSAADNTATKSRDNVKPDAELDADVSKVEDDAKAAQAKAMAAVEEKKAAAKSKKAAEEKAAAPAEESDDLEDDAPVLDYKNDVRPVLLAAIKRTSKEQVQALVKSYGVDKAEQIDPAKFADVLAKAEKLGA